MILFEVVDNKIWNLENKLIEILNQALTTTGPIILNFSEGPCLRSCGFYDLLDNLCQTFNIDKSRFCIHTFNVEEFHDEYSIKVMNNPWILASQLHLRDDYDKSQNLKHFGCFVGRLSLTRLSILSYLDSYYHDQTILTCHYDKHIPDLQPSLPLNQLHDEFPEMLELAVNFLKTCPRNSFGSWGEFYMRRSHDKTCGTDPLEWNPMAKQVIGNFNQAYDNVFLEIVCETFYSGFTFFPTEKTFRPMVQLTPFIMCAGQGSLSNLQRCGFKTFDKFWNEDYDNFSGPDRVREIFKVIDGISVLSQSDLQTMYHDMMPILKHNKDRLLKLTAKDIKLDCQK